MKAIISDYNEEIDDRVIDIQIDKWDTYSCDTTIAEIVHPLLIKFKEDRKIAAGVPFEFFRKTDQIDEHGNYTNEAIAKANVRYEKFLDECIWAFGRLISRKDGDLEIDEYPKIQKILSKFGKHMMTLWW